LTPEQKLANKRESNRRWAEANREKMIASRLKYEAANKEKIAAYKAAARKADPEKFKARVERWREQNQDKEKARSARKYKENKAEVIAQLRAWRAENPERLREVIAAGRRRRAEKRRQYANERHANNVQARLATLIRNRLRKAVRGQRPESAILTLGCSLAQAVAHIEARFLSGMSWANHGDWHIDHKRPLASFDLTDASQYAEACHYTNLQPMWGRENQSKGSRYDEEADARPKEHRMD
jgi:hypothetical protein